MAERALAKTISRARYVATQGARVAWYMGQYMLAKRLSGPVDPPNEPKFKPQAKPGDARRIRAIFLDLFAKDRANIEAGLYPAPSDARFDKALSTLSNSLKFFQDLPHVDRRRLERDGVEIRSAIANHNARYPAYYLQNFHFQSGGWFTEDSAKLYDTQVEILFGGAADAMRRIALGHIARSLKGRDQRGVKLLDMACGNGRFLSQILEAFPKLKATGLDLSPAYVSEAKTRLSVWPQAEIVIGQAESAPFDDASFDLVSCVYLFHELPPKVRLAVAKEIVRVLKPGGVFVLADSLQWDDTPDLNQMLEYFPIGFHEPFYASYLREELKALFAEAGLVCEETEFAFLTKVMRFRKPAAS
jgi:ubiquinone/menaquinone biosynthesis C-methylase UbiE